MPGREQHMDAMLRHLGAAYYDALHGRASEEDVDRAVRQVAGRIGETSIPGPEHDGSRTDSGTAGQHHRRHHSFVRDVMTTSVVTVDRITPYKEIVGLLTRHHIGAVPVLKLGRHVAGVVTGADLVGVAAAARDSSDGWIERHIGHHHQAPTAEQLMTSPAITTHPEASIASAARLMAKNHVGRLPVVNKAGALIGIVSRRDILKVFLRPDDDIARQVTELIAEALPEAPESLAATVQNGVVTITGSLGHAEHDELRAIVRQANAIEGVIDVLDQTGSPVQAEAPSV